MAQYIDKEKIVAEIERRINEIDEFGTYLSPKGTLTNLLCHLDTLEVKDVDLEKESELIANEIMIGVQANKYHTNIYNTNRNDFNHSHLCLAARKGIELGLKAQKGE